MLMTELTNIQERIISVLKSGPKTRAEICDDLGFEKYTHKYFLKYKTHNGTIRRYYFEEEYHKKRTTIFDNLKKLFKRKIVGKKKSDKNKGKRGRPPTLWYLKEGKN